MKDHLKKIVMFAGLLGVMHSSFAGLKDTPEGYWKTIDDVTGKPKSIVQIWRGENQALMGKVVKIFPREGQAPITVCKACTGEKHNQPLVGMVILAGLKLQKDEWKNGEILDPANGKTYNCSVRLAENGQKLNVHGFIGMPLFGRSQTWERVDLMAG